MPDRTALLEDSLAGVPLREIGKRHKISHETVRQHVQKAKRAEVTRMAGELLVNRRTGDIEWLVIPGFSGTLEFDAALAYFVWIVDELSDLGLTLKIHQRSEPAWIVLGLEDVSGQVPQEEKP